ncbi:MAG: hypothetical protein II110_10420, partial [Treponema sp.]|nr:hypothetical protein [Treponema sp.]
YELNSEETDYYESDGTHPQPIGSFLSASTFYYTIFEEEPLISWSDADVNNLLNLINSYVSDSATTGKRVSYSKDLLSKVNSIAHKYSRAIAPCAKDTSGSTPYLSVAGAYTYPATE